MSNSSLVWNRVMFSKYMMLTNDKIVIIYLAHSLRFHIFHRILTQRNSWNFLWFSSLCLLVPSGASFMASVCFNASESRWHQREVSCSGIMQKSTFFFYTNSLPLMQYSICGKTRGRSAMYFLFLWLFFWGRVNTNLGGWEAPEGG